MENKMNVQSEPTKEQAIAWAKGSGIANQFFFPELVEHYHAFAKQAFKAGQDCEKAAQDKLKEAVENLLTHVVSNGDSHRSTCLPHDIKMVREAMGEKAKEYAWECNECGSQEYTMAVSESDVQSLGCGNCGGDEWHKAEARN